MSRKKNREARLLARKVYLALGEAMEQGQTPMQWAIGGLVHTVGFAEFPGGTCFWRNYFGSMVLSRFEIPNKLILGGAMYRASERPHDVLMFCGSDNRGHNPGRFHCWIETADEIIDFSSGDWKELYTDKSFDAKQWPPPIRWDFPPPLFLWQERSALLDAWRPAPMGTEARTSLVLSARRMGSGKTRNRTARNARTSCSSS